MPLTPYTLAIFLHVVGALGFFMALGLEWFMLQRLDRVTTTQEAVQWLKRAKGIQSFSGTSLLLVLTAGLYMTFAAWGRAYWIEVAFSAVILQAAIAGIITGPRIRAMRTAITAEPADTLSSAMQTQLRHPLLRVSLLSRMGIALGIIFLMTIKPALTLSLIAIAAGLLIGGLSSLLMMRRAAQRAAA